MRVGVIGGIVMRDKVFIDYGMSHADKKRLGLKCGWVTREEAEESKQRYEELLNNSTYRRTAEMPYLQGTTQ